MRRAALGAVRPLRYGVSGGRAILRRCGANLAAAVHQQTEQFETNLLTVEQLQADGRYEEAIALLGPMSNMEHPRLNHHAKMATEYIKRLGAEQQQASGKAEEVCRQARRADRHDYRGAIRLPGGRARRAAQRGLREAPGRGGRAAAGAVRAESRPAGGVAGKRVWAAMPLIARLLELKPDHAQARQIAEHVQKHFAHAAQAKLAKYRYEEAVKVLDHVPESLQSAEVAALARGCSELALIAWNVRHAAVVAGALLAAVNRMRKLAPGDPRGGKLSAECGVVASRRRRKAGWPRPRGPRRRPTRPWAFPIDWLNGLGRIAAGPAGSKRREPPNPGCFAVACGLALQGLAEPVRLNLRT